jgi:hypothetical protein
VSALAAVGVVATTVALGVGMAVQDRARQNYRAQVRASQTAAAHAMSDPGPVASPVGVWARHARTGWHAAIEAGRLAVVVGPVADPGNPGCALVLAADPTGALGDVRVLIGIDPATGTEIALPVPTDLDHPIEAAAWTYTDPAHPVNPTAEDYADLTTRT